jgi:hypothetical protein
MNGSDAPVKRVDRTIWLFGLGYFIAYTPYAALVKALSAGRLPGMAGIDGLTLLPSVLAGTIVTLPIYVLLLGWRRYACVPSRAVIISGFGTALIIATTTLAYAFHNISVLFALLLLRGGMLIIAPITDLIGGRRVRWFSSVALVISLSAVLLGIVATNNHRLTAAAIINLAVYLAGYQIRLPQMTRYAKIEHPETTRTYFVCEIMVTLVFLALIPLTGAAFGVESLRHGLLLVVSGTATASVGFLIGVLYATLYVFTTLIYLDRRENTFCMSMNVCSSLLAGMAASYALTRVLGMPTPPWFELTGVGMIMIALMFLSPLHHVPEWVYAAAVQRLPFGHARKGD